MSLQWTGRRISGIDGRVRASLNDIRGEELLEAEPIAGGVEDPGIVVGALHAGVQPQCLPGQLPRGQGTGVGQRAVRLALAEAHSDIFCNPPSTAISFSFKVQSEKNLFRKLA